MHRILTRTDLLEFIRDHAPSSAVRRAVDEGSNESLGAFAALPPHTSPGFIVTITSKHGKTWPVCVLVNEHQHRHEVYILDAIPWSLWDGGVLPLYCGDDPYHYRRMRDRARSQS